MRIILASNNENKIIELRSILKENDINLEVLSLNDIGFLEDIIEDGHSFEQNALIKAQAIAKLYPNDCVIADDSGLCCYGLDLAPGIYSARYSDGGDNNEKLLFELSSVSDRRAYFITCLCYIMPQSSPRFVIGTVDGIILEKKQGENGFGYDPLFSIDGKTSFAELSFEEKNKLSHRHNAFVNLMQEGVLKNV